MPATGAEQHLVFISHSATDLWVANQIAAHVKSCGAKVFLDEAEIAVGADFEEDILSHLEKADELLVLLTPWSFSVRMSGRSWARRGV